MSRKPSVNVASFEAGFADTKARVRRVRLRHLAERQYFFRLASTGMASMAGLPGCGHQFGVNGGHHYATPSTRRSSATGQANRP